MPEAWYAFSCKLGEGKAEGCTAVRAVHREIRRLLWRVTLLQVVKSEGRSIISKWEPGRCVTAFWF